MAQNRVNARIAALCMIPLAALMLAGCAGFGTQPIGQVHACMENSEIPPVDRAISVEGIVHQVLVYNPPASEAYHGFVIQNPEADADDNPVTSDGIYVDMSTNGFIRTSLGRLYRPHIGDVVRLRGIMASSGGQTVLQRVTVKKVLRKKAKIDEELRPFVANPPDDAAEADIYWRQHEGMRCEVPAGALVSGAHCDSMGSLVYLIHPSHPLTARKNIYARRAFRDAHPMDDCDDVFDNQNGYLIGLGPLGLPRAKDAPMPALPATCTFETLKEPVRGAVSRFMGSYMVQVETLPVFKAGTDPSVNRAKAPAADKDLLRIATYNIENLYDHRDDPFDSRDYYDYKNATPVLDEEGKFQGYTGLQVFDYVPASREIYREKIRGLAAQIIEDLQSPDILMVQEVEDQDIGVMADGKLERTDIDNRDGLPDVLQELAAEIRSQGGPVYETACDRAAADGRGIITAFLYQPERVKLAEVEKDHPVMGELPWVHTSGRTLAYSGRASNPKTFNMLHEILGIVYERGPQMAAFDFAAGGENHRIYLLNNHFKSQPQNFVLDRQNQAGFSADLVRAIQREDKEALVIVGGDLNTFPRPDEPDPLLPADQLGALYDADLMSLYDEMLKARPENAYSYVFKGQAQTLDHLFVTDPLLKRLKYVSAVHINSDFIGDDKYPRRGHSDHDPILSCFEF
ncbi:MAG: endonuclease/exonuclease/phosphatase family protein [Kiritimatiellia bacterium]